MKREIKNYLKKPLFWLGIVLVVFAVYQQLEPYLNIHYMSSEEMEQLVHDYPQAVPDADISDGYVPSDEGQRRKLWEEKMKESLVSDCGMDPAKAEYAIEKVKGMTVEEACQYFEKECSYYGAIYAYGDTKYHQGTKEEINSYIQEKLQDKSFSYYFSRKFADFAGLFLAFFAMVMLAALFLQDTKRNTYELLHTKPISAGKYVLGKVAGGFAVSSIALAVLNLVFWILCLVYAGASGFEVHLFDFVAASCLYILPNMMMIVCVYALISLVFKNPLPAVPLLILHMVYSNMGSQNAEGVYGYYGRLLAIMVRFPGQFFDTAPPPMALLNQSFLVLASIGIIFICVQLWKRRRI